MNKHHEQNVQHRILAICFFLGVLLLSSVNAQPTVSIDPAATNADIGDEFTIDIVLKNMDELRGGSVKILFDGAMLDVKSITDGGFLKSFGSTFSFSDYDNDAGWVQYDESILGAGTMASGDGVFCSITFTVIDNGVSALSFDTVDLRNRDNATIDVTTENATVSVGDSGILTKIKVFLEGPYSTENSMLTSLLESDRIPVSSPYSEAPRVVSSVPENITDWILVELRTLSSGAAVVSQSFFLRNDGYIVDMNGQTTDLSFPGLDEGGYYIVLHHRNHISVMSKNSVHLSSSPTGVYDFTTDMNKYYGEQAKLLTSEPTDRYGMFSGDGDSSNDITINDRDNILLNRDSSGYLDGDYNLSGIITIQDAEISIINMNITTNVP